MTSNSNPQNDTKQIDERLAETFLAGGKYNALFLGVTGIGFAVIYILTQYALLGQPTPSLLYIIGTVLSLAVVRIITTFAASRKKGIAARFLSSISTIVFAILISYYWEGFVYIAVILIFIPPLTAIGAGMPNRYRPYLYTLILIGIIGILVANANTHLERIQSLTTTGIASITFLGAFGLLLIAVTVISKSKRFSNLRNQLLTLIIIIVTVPIVTATLISAMSASTNNQSQTLVVNSLLALLAVVMAFAAVTITADSISEPISVLAEIAEKFAVGQLDIRATLNRQDEIGDLSKAYNQIAEQLQSIIGRLEQRVNDRTKELENQSNRLRVAVEIARDAATSRDLTSLLDQASRLIQERFGFYHTGVFLLDNNKEYAILTSSPTDSGKQMIANNHKVRAGEAGIVGRVAATGESRITLDTNLETSQTNNTLLPRTRSEMALPLKVQNNLIGILDVQSEQPQAFQEEDIAIMQLLADQLAIAIERTQLLQQVEQNLNDLGDAYGKFTREGWKTLNQSGLISHAGYRFDNVRIQPIDEPPALGAEAIRTGNTVINNYNKNSAEEYTVAIPIKLRGQSIGAVTARLKEGYTQNTISTIELAIERLAASLESARLYEEARQRADREQAISQVTTAISASTEYEDILRTTVREIGNLLNDTEVAIQILGEADEQRSDR